uniref:NADH-ubiquinone oxidoreductase chain 3 n=1 Tax=Parakontikia atrata TaxID=2903269 RepID=A0A9E8AE40_9PLAT|nr:NADH dehydrogenase subunit 3 [Parakontikia atrata]UZA66416.1 NADH dehydrogenase subunit 3 [Parakontikia atrata]
MFIFLGFFFFFFSILGFLLIVWLYWVDLGNSNSFRESLSPYECGFDGKDLSRLPFSLRFFLIVIIYIILDVEICLLLQLPYEIDNYLYGNHLWFFVFVFILFLGILEEFRLGLLSWK